MTLSPFELRRLWAYVSTAQHVQRQIKQHAHVSHPSGLPRPCSVESLGELEPRRIAIGRELEDGEAGHVDGAEAEHGLDGGGDVQEHAVERELGPELVLADAALGFDDGAREAVERALATDEDDTLRERSGIRRGLTLIERTFCWPRSVSWCSLPWASIQTWSDCRRLMRYSKLICRLAAVVADEASLSPRMRAVRSAGWQSSNKLLPMSSAGSYSSRVVAEGEAKRMTPFMLMTWTKSSHC